jgi:hypothetical protein
VAGSSPAAPAILGLMTACDRQCFQKFPTVCNCLQLNLRGYFLQSSHPRNAVFILGRVAQNELCETERGLSQTAADENHKYACDISDVLNLTRCELGQLALRPFGQHSLKMRNVALIAWLLHYQAFWFLTMHSYRN